MADTPITFEMMRERRENLIRLIELETIKLLILRKQWLPMKDSTFTSDLARRTEMEFRTAAEQAKLDADIHTLELVTDDMKYLIATEGKTT